MSTIDPKMVTMAAVMHFYRYAMTQASAQMCNAALGADVAEVRQVYVGDDPPAGWERLECDQCHSVAWIPPGTGLVGALCGDCASQIFE